MPQSVPYRKLVRFFLKQKFTLLRQKGSHERYSHADGRKITIPKHTEIAYGTFVAICEQAKLSARSVLKEL